MLNINSKGREGINTLESNLSRQCDLSIYMLIHKSKKKKKKVASACISVACLPCPSISNTQTFTKSRKTLMRIIRDVFVYVYCPCGAPWSCVKSTCSLVPLAYGRTGRYVMLNIKGPWRRARADAVLQGCGWHRAAFLGHCPCSPTAAGL